jgi:hypothetical protein
VSRSEPNGVDAGAAEEGVGKAGSAEYDGKEDGAENCWPGWNTCPG